MRYSKLANFRDKGSRILFNVCPACGEYDAEKLVTPGANIATCRGCGHEHAFLRLPLLIVTGASGTGKTTVALELASRMRDCVCLESDILWRDEYARADNDYTDYRNTWLRVAKNIGQAGRPVVLFGSATPGQFEPCIESRYFSSISYLAFVCAENEIVRRLQARPGWRKSGSDEVVQRMVGFNKWLMEHAQTTNPPMELCDTTNITLEESVNKTSAWIRSCILKSLNEG